MRNLIWPLGAAAVLLTACGQPTGPWSVPSKPGLWHQTGVAGDMAGQNLVECNGPGLNMVVDEQKPTMDNGATCPAATRAAIQGGWTSTQVCDLHGQKATFVEQVIGDRATDVTETLTATGPTGASIGGGTIHIAWVGDCPAGWKPGDNLDLVRENTAGEWRLTHPGAMTTFEVLQSLPPEVARLVPTSTPPPQTP